MEKISFRDVLSYALCGDERLGNAGPALDEELPKDSIGACEYRTPGVFPRNVDEVLPDLLVSGVPGSGKTQFALTLAMASAMKRGIVFYAAPTRPLAQENANRLRSLAKGLLDEGDIILSTGDRCVDDWKLHQNSGFICCTIFEKLLSLLLSSRSLQNRIALVIVDEAHMFNEDSRGVRLDMLISQLTSNEERKGRVVLLTVESPRNCKFLLEFLKKRKDDEFVPPLHLSGRSRPGTVAHKLVLHRKSKADGALIIKEMPLTVLSSTSPLYLSEEELKEKECSVLTLMKEQESVSRKDWMSYPIDVDVLETWAKPGHNVLVVNMSIHMLKEGLMAMHAARKVRRPPSSDAASFKERLKKLAEAGIISNRQCKNLSDWAMYGLFLHTGDMHAALRDAVEQTFREPSENGRILFSTTTLAYGVNLDLDTVLLTSLTFSMDNKAPRYIDGVVLHNIMGRAARRSGQAGEAVILLPALRNTAKKALLSENLTEAIIDCYRPKELPLLTPNPLSQEEGLSDNDLSSNNQTRMLYFFLYAIEFASQKSERDAWLRAGQVAEELWRCVHARAAWKDKGWEKFSAFVGNVLDRLTVSIPLCPGFEIRFVEAKGEGRDRRWKGTAWGRPLLNCGVSVREAEILSRWLSRTRKEFFSWEMATFPIYWLASIITLPSVQKILVNSYDSDNPPVCSDDSFRKQIMKIGRSSGMTRQATEHFLHRFLPLFDKFCADAGEAEWEKRQVYTRTVSDLNKKRKEIMDGLRNRSRLGLLALWRWMDGKILEDVEMAFGLSSSERQYFPARLTERCAWLLLFIPQFFADSPLITTADAAHAAWMEAHMRWGLSDGLLHFRDEDNFSRTKAAELYTSSPASLILDVDKSEAGMLVRKNIRTAMEQFRLWVGLVLGDNEFSARLWDCLDAGMKGNWKKSFDMLYEECPRPDWAGMLRSCPKKVQLKKFWAALAVVALYRKGWWDPKQDSVPNDLLDVFHMLIGKGHSWDMAGPLTFIHLP